MQFAKIENVYRVARITGPNHNLLGIELGDESYDSVAIEALPDNKSSDTCLPIEDVKRYVLEGVRQANKEFGTNYLVKRIEFVASDTPPAEIYKLLAYTIIERLSRKNIFSTPEQPNSAT